MNVFDLIKDSRKEIAVGVIADIINAALCVAASLCLSSVLKAAMQGNWRNCTVYILLNGILYLIASAFEYLFTYEKNRVREHGLNKYRTLVSREIENAKSQFNADKYISSLNNDSVQVDDAITTVFSLIDAFAFTVFGIIGLVYLHWSILLGSVLIVLATAFSARILQPLSRKNEQRRSTALETFYGRISDLLNGYHVFHAYNQKPVLNDLLTNRSREFESNRRIINNRMKQYELIPVMISLLGQCGLMLLTVYLADKQFISISNLLAVGNLSGMFNNYVGVFFSEIVKVDGYNAIINEKCHSFEKQKLQAEQFDSCDIHIHDLSYSFPDKEVLKDLTLDIAEGSKNLIIGPSGCGKSTLLNVLAGNLTDYHGDVFVGDKNLKNITDYSIHDIVGYIQQSAYVFADSTRHNIDLYRLCPDDEVKEACRKSLVTEFCDETKLDDSVKSSELSGGQKQRIALAREFVSDHKIILFDESLNALDPVMTEQILNYILSLPQTVIMVSHKYTEEMKTRFDQIIELH